MRVFIFGAGASVAAQQPDLPEEYLAPLADDLFHPRYTASADEMNLDNDLMNRWRSAANETGSLEKWLTQKWEAIPAINSKIKKETEFSSFGNLSFYVWRVLQKVSIQSRENKYVDFLEKLSRGRDEDYGLISFNYDTLLDQAICQVRKTFFESFDAYQKEGYLKPHGSINWFFRARQEDPLTPPEVTYDVPVRIRMAERCMFNGAPLGLHGAYVLDPRNQDLLNTSRLDHLFRMSGSYFYPLVLVPLLSKLYSFVPELNARINLEGKEMLANASEVYLIGYRAADDIIFDLMEHIKQGTKLHVIGRNTESVKQTFERVTSNPKVAGRYTQGILSDVGFEGLVEKIDYYS